MTITTKSGFSRTVTKDCGEWNCKDCKYWEEIKREILSKRRGICKREMYEYDEDFGCKFWEGRQ